MEWNSRNSVRIIKYPEFDSTIATWVLECESRNIHISYDIIKQKANEFATLMNIENPPKFSNGWMQIHQKAWFLQVQFTWREWISEYATTELCIDIAANQNSNVLPL